MPEKTNHSHTSEKQFLKLNEKCNATPPPAKRLKVHVPQVKVQPNDAAVKREKDQKHLVAMANLRNCGIGKRHIEMLAKPNVLEAHAQWRTRTSDLLAILRGGHAVMLIGDRGNGKTQAATRVLWDFCERGKTVRYVVATEIHDDWLDAQGGNSRIVTTHKYVINDLLVVDAIHERYETDAARRILTRILDRRYADKLATLLIGNCKEQSLPEILGPDVMDRFREGGGVMQFDWPSFRGKADTQ